MWPGSGRYMVVVLGWLALRARTALHAGPLPQASTSEIAVQLARTYCLQATVKWESAEDPDSSLIKASESEKSKQDDLGEPSFRSLHEREGIEHKAEVAGIFTHTWAVMRWVIF